MLLLLLLPILVAGFIILTKHPAYFYKLHRYDGQLLYLSSAHQGLVCTIVGATLVFTFDHYLPGSMTILGFQIPINFRNWVEQLIAPIDGGENIVWVILVTLSAMLVAYLRILSFRVRAQFKYELLNREQDKPELSAKVLSEIALMRTILKDSPLDSLFYDSFVSQSASDYLMLTMDDRKVYVGKVISLGEPTESEGMDQEITITPFMSGYRHNKTLKVQFTTKYNKVDDDIALVLRQDKIVSATRFNPKIYEKFQAQQQNRAAAEQKIEQNPAEETTPETEPTSPGKENRDK